jgi:hypothetical protein
MYSPAGCVAFFVEIPICNIFWFALNCAIIIKSLQRNGGIMQVPFLFEKNKYKKTPSKPVHFPVFTANTNKKAALSKESRPGKVERRF